MIKLISFLDSFSVSRQKRAVPQVLVRFARQIARDLGVADDERLAERFSHRLRTTAVEEGKKATYAELDSTSSEEDSAIEEEQRIAISSDSSDDDFDLSATDR